MSREILVWRYALERKKDFKSNARLNAYQGALLQVEGGFACIHPWEMYGDDSLDKQLEALKNGIHTPLIKKSLYFAKVDAEARQEKRSLFSSDLEIPPSHALITNISNLEGELNKNLEAYIAQGFTRFKIKLGASELNEEIKHLERLCWAAEGMDLKFRLDFNGQLECGKMETLLSRFSSNLLNRLDFIEDPCPYEIQHWENFQKQFQIRLARDWYEGDENDGFEVFVLKPARQNTLDYCQRAADQMKRVVVTSYMDHPVGQIFAAWEAAQALKVHPLLIDDCGLLTHQLFMEDEFTEAIHSQGPQLMPVCGNGIGFDEQLKKLPWKKL